MLSLFVRLRLTGPVGPASAPPEPPDQFAVPAGRTRGRTVGAQEGDDVLTPEGGREVDRGGAALVGEGVRSGVEEQGGDLDMPFEGHASERRLALSVTEVDRGPCLKQHRDRLGLAVIGRQHQQRIPFGVLRVHRQAAFDQRMQTGRISLAGELGGFFWE